MMTAGEKLTRGGVTYVVESYKTPDERRACGHVNVADAMERSGIAADIWMRRPRGRVLFQMWEFGDGRFSSLTRIG